MQLPDLGITFIPDVLSKTPAYIDAVQPGSPAAKAELQQDDLVLFLNSIRITSQATLRDELQYIDRADSIALLVQRGNQLREVLLAP